MAKAPRQFRGAKASSDRARRRTYDRFRPNANARLYDRRWRKARAVFLAEHPLCWECLRKAPRRDKLAIEVDHIVPHKGDRELFWDRNNWQPLCKACHSAKTLRDQRSSPQG